MVNSVDLNYVPRCCQQLVLQLLHYNPTGVHAPGKNTIIADILSQVQVLEFVAASMLGSLLDAYLCATSHDDPIFTNVSPPLYMI